MINQWTKMAVLTAGLVGASLSGQAADSGTKTTTPPLTISPAKLVTYPGYQTVFTTDHDDPAAITWYLSGTGNINQSRFQPLGVGRAAILARTPTGEALAPIEVLPPTATITGRTIADFDQVVPVATSPVEGFWQVFNAGGSFVRLVDNPLKDEANPSERCVEMDRTARHGSHGFATKPTLLLGGEHSTLELLIRGDTLTEFYWKAQLQTGAESAGYSDKSEIAGESVPLVPRKWNKVTLHLEPGAGRYLRYVSLFANSKSTAPVDVFQVDQVRWVK